LKTRVSTLGDTPRTESAAFRVVDGAPSVAEHRGASPDSSDPATVADLVAAELEAALELRRTGADARQLRRALRRIEELLDE
jgi:hypothetical protein